MKGGGESLKEPEWSREKDKDFRKSSNTIVPRQVAFWTHMKSIFDVLVYFLTN